MQVIGGKNVWCENRNQRNSSGSIIPATYGLSNEATQATHEAEKVMALHKGLRQELKACLKGHNHDTVEKLLKKTAIESESGSKSGEG